MGLKKKVNFLFINDVGGGYAKPESTAVGTTVGAFLSANMENWKPEGYAIRLNNNATAESDVLKEGDRLVVTCINKKIESA